MTAPAVHYTVVPADPGAHLFQVTLRVAAPDPAGQRLWMPAWIPGSYMIRDFARHVVTLEARDAGGPLPVEKLDKQTWRCAPARGVLEVRYQVYAWDLSVRGAHFDQTHAYFNGPCLFLAAAGREDAPCAVTLHPPPGLDHWRVATTLPRAPGTPLWGFGDYAAADYDELIDHPVEMGTFDLVDFSVAGTPHHVAVTGRHRGDLDRLARDLRRICQTHVDLFGGLPAMERYLFLVTAVGEGYGGLEHRSSCSLLCKRDELPPPGGTAVDEDYRNLLGLCSHEYFHLWNVKRIRPRAFVPFDLTREVHTRLLWAFEGITSYYDDLALARSGVITPESYLELLGRTATRVWRGPGRRLQSIAESSFDAWTRFYKQDENAANAIVSYYTKGALVALALDLTLRRASRDAAGLDDLMRRLWQDYGRTGTGVPEDAVEALAAELAGTPLDDFFARHVHGTEDPPLAELLRDVGVAWHLRPAAGPDDKGGRPAADIPPVHLGARLEPGDGGLRVAAVTWGGPAHAAGLAAGDVLVAADGVRATSGGLARRLRYARPGERLRLHAFRRDELLELELVLGAPPADTVYLEFQEDPAPEILARRQRWLGARE